MHILLTDTNSSCPAHTSALAHRRQACRERYMFVAQPAHLSTLEPLIAFVCMSLVPPPELGCMGDQAVLVPRGDATVCDLMLQGTRDYNVGDGADVAAQAAAQQMGIELPKDFQARQINPEKDIVQFDIVLVMDKFTAADVLREVLLFCYIVHVSGDSIAAS